MQGFSKNAHWNKIKVYPFHTMLEELEYEYDTMQKEGTWQAENESFQIIELLMNKLKALYFTFQHFSEAVFILNVNGKILDLNRAAANLLKEEEQNLRRTYFATQLDKTNKEIFLQNFHKSIENEIITNCELTFSINAHQKFNIQISNGLKTDDGKTIYIQTIPQKISEIDNSKTNSNNQNNISSINWVYSPTCKEISFDTPELFQTKNSLIQIFRTVYKPDLKILFSFLKQKPTNLQTKTCNIRILTTENQYEYYTLEYPKKHFSGSNTIFGSRLFRKTVPTKEEENNTLHEKLLLGTVLNTLTTGVTVSDDQGKFLVYNEIMQTITGYSLEEANSINFLDALYPDENERNRVLSEIAAVKKNKISQNRKKTLKTKNGNYITVMVSTIYVPINDKWSYLSTYTQMKDNSADNLLINKEELFLSLAEQVTEGVCFTNQKGEIIIWNNALEHITQIPSNVAIGKEVWEIEQKIIAKDSTTKFDSEEHKKLFNNFVNSGDKSETKIFELKIYPTQHSEAYVKVTLFKIYTESGIYVGKTVKDITYKKISQNELKLLWYAIEKSPVSIYITNNEGIIEFVNKKAIEITEYSFSDLLGQKPDFLPKDTETDPQEILHTIHNKQVWSGELQRVTKKGKVFWEYVTITPIFNDNQLSRLISMHIDISDLKRTLSTLQETENKYRLALEVTSDCIWEWHSERGLILCNKLIEILGIKNKSTPEIFLELEKIIHQNNITEIKEIAQAIRYGNISYFEKEIQMKLKTNDWSWFHVSGKTVKHALDGKALQIIGSINEKKETISNKKELISNEQQFRNFYELSNDAIAIHEQGLCIDANNAFVKLFKYERNEIIGANLLNLIVHPDYRELVLYKIKYQTITPYEIIALDKERNLLKLEVESRNEEYDDKLVRLSVFRNLLKPQTVEKQDAIHNNDLLFLSQSTTQIFLLNDEPKILSFFTKSLLQYVNNSLLLCYTFNNESNSLNLSYLEAPSKWIEITKTPELYFQLTIDIHENIPYEILVGNVQIKKAEKNPTFFQFPIILNNNLINELGVENITVFHLAKRKNYYATVFLFSQHNVNEKIEIFKIFNNITINALNSITILDEVKQLKKEPHLLKIEHAETEENVTATIQTTSNQTITEKKPSENETFNQNSNTENSNREKNFYKTTNTISLINRNLKNPISLLATLTGILRNSYNTLNDNKLKTYIEQLYKTSQQSSSILEDLLQWARLQNPEIKANIAKINLKTILSDCIVNFELQLKNKELTVVENIEEKLYAFADRNMIVSVFRNLISNAIKFSFRGGKIFFSSEKNNDFCTVHIQDFGIGIEMELQKKLFNINETFSMEGTDNEKGTGFGLILAKEMVELNYGKLGFVGKKDEGSIFSVQLPVYKAVLYS